MDILNIRLKNAQKEFCSYKLTPPTANAKWEDKLDPKTKPFVYTVKDKNTYILFAFLGFSG